MVQDTQAAMTQTMAEAGRALDEQGLTEIAVLRRNPVGRRGT